MPRKSLDSKPRSNQFIERIAEDRYVLAVVLVGSLSTETIWARESLGLWIIEADGVSRRLPSDGEDERVFRILVENGINIHAEVIPAQPLQENGRRGVADGVFVQFLRTSPDRLQQGSVDRELVQEGQQPSRPRTRSGSC